jgi:hypothetical protein
MAGCVTADITTAHAAVKQLMENVEGHRHKLYMNNFFLLPDLLSDLTEISCCEVVRPDRKGMPQSSGCCCFLLVSFLSYPLTLKMEAVCFSRMSLDFYWASGCYIPEDSSLHRFCLLPASCWFLDWFTRWQWRWRHYFPSKHGWSSTRLHGITYQKV